MMGVAVLIASVVLVAFAQLNYKQFAVHRCRRRLAIALTCFGLSQIGFFVALMSIKVGVVYMSTAVTQVLVLILSHYVLKESVGRHHWIAITLIAAGLALYAT